MSGPADWYLAAEARHAHLPQGEERERRVQATFERIRDEAELIALRLPELEADEQKAIREEAVWSVMRDRGCPQTEEELASFTTHANQLLDLLEVQARYRKAPKRVQLQLEKRHFYRMKGVLGYLGTGML